MRPTSYSAILSALCDDMGYERSPDGSPNLTDEQWHAAKRAVSQAIGILWPLAFWRELLEPEERWFAPDWDPDEAVVAGQVRFHRGAKGYYLCLKTTPATNPAQLVGGVWENIEGDWTSAAIAYEGDAFWDNASVYVVGDRVTHPETAVAYQCIQGNAGQKPPNAAYWGALTPWQPAIDKFQEGKTSIGRVEGVYTVNPKVYRGARRLEFVERGDVVHLRTLEKNSAWVNFMPPTPKLTGDVWSTSAAYTAIDDGGSGTSGVVIASSRYLGIPGRVALRARALHVDREIVDLLYLVTDGDDSGGKFRYVASETKADDGSDYIRPNNVPPDSPGRWIRDLNLT